jgi:phosphate transport system substrate-binding protein
MRKTRRSSPNLHAPNHGGNFVTAYITPCKFFSSFGSLNGTKSLVSTVMKRLLTVALFALGIFVAGCKGKTAPPETLTGSGSTFVWPIMARWAPEFEKAEGKKVDYWPRGSSRGIQDLLDKKDDFACSDGPLSDEEMAKFRSQGHEVVHIPVILSAVVVVYNLEGIHDSIRFTAPILADIYLGKIKKWNHQALRDINPTLSLPDRDIAVIHRSDGSGSTFIWTDYLAKGSSDWKEKVGAGRSVAWPAGAGADGNEGVAGRVRETPGSIGYLDLADAYRKSLIFGLILNQEKEYVRANLESVVKAAENMRPKIPEDLRYSLTDAPGKGTYPIVGTTWAIVHLDQSDNPRRKQLVKFLQWLVVDGQSFAEQLLYARLPGYLAERSSIAIDRIKVAK